ncbi:MAG TPA: CDP-alcohol phosphatidyltransferase family protein [Polyangia bacterium]|jgi:CDP-diacylglycerol--glycerol-3-phosphate 3-phosphatidyltransferase|nr:CDP-alcohol phosphatidyltransferase family protein [Polyangia bacterium]
MLMYIEDIYFSIFMLILVVLTVGVYFVRALVVGRARHARTDADGGSVFLNKASMEMGYWLLNPLVRALVALHITPNMVTAFSLVPALLAGVAAAFGWFGLACVLATAGSLCDLLDGVLARRTGVASDAGEVFDAAVDRYVEFFFLGGVAVYYRTHWMVLVLTLAAIFGSLMFSYTTAKGEALQVTLPRGSMRRAERAVYLLVAAGLTPFTRAAFDGTPSHALRELPIIFALSLVAVITNVAVIQRFGALAAALRARRPSEQPPPTTDHGIISDRDTPARSA